MRRRGLASLNLVLVVLFIGSVWRFCPDEPRIYLRHGDRPDRRSRCECNRNGY